MLSDPGSTLQVRSKNVPGCAVATVRCAGCGPPPGPLRSFSAKARSSAWTPTSFSAKVKLAPECWYGCAEPCMYRW